MRNSNTAIGRPRDREVVPQTPDGDQNKEDQDADEQASEDDEDTENDELVPAVVPIEDDE